MPDGANVKDCLSEGGGLVLAVIVSIEGIGCLCSANRGSVGYVHSKERGSVHSNFRSEVKPPKFRLKLRPSECILAVIREYIYRFKRTCI